MSKMKEVPNAKAKLIGMLISVLLMIFTVTQTYYLAMYTLGQEISEDKMAIYKWVVKLVNYEDNNEQVEQDAYQVSE
ncbi:MAG: hypothetical protein IKL68_01800 [Clostridia bacterium]|nr:hypothetical protein [Clostridia bacterium]